MAMTLQFSGSDNDNEAIMVAIAAMVCSLSGGGVANRTLSFC